MMRRRWRGRGRPAAPAVTAARCITAGSLGVAGALHLAWGRGSSFPFATRAQLSDNVVGSSETPSPASCYVVATGLGALALIAASPSRGRLRRVIIRSAAAVLALRASFGFAGRTDLLVPGSSSLPFRRNDRRILSPVCAVLAIGLVASTR